MNLQLPVHMTGFEKINLLYTTAMYPSIHILYILFSEIMNQISTMGLK